MISALFYLQFHSIKNRLATRFKRLKQPKYLVGAIVGGLYFYWYFFRLLIPNRGTANAPQFSVEPLFIESLGALALLGFVLFAWIIPNKRAALAFSEAEIAFLFPAPISRRGLIHFKLLRSQVAILFTVLLLTLVSNRFASGGRALIHAAGWWVILFTLNLHFIGSSFALTMLLDRGISNWKRRVAVFGLAVFALLAVGTWAIREFPDLTTDHLANPKALLAYARQALVSGPLPYLLYPFRIVVKPYLAPDGLAFLAAMAPAVLLIGLHYVWVLRADVAFEEASVEVSKKAAEKIAAVRAGKMGVPATMLKRKRPPFELAPVGAAPVAFLWKNLISAGSAFRARTWLVLAVMAAVVGSATLSASGDALPVMLGSIAGMFAIWTLLLGPQILRQDFRHDLPHAELLKVYPIPAWQLALGEILAPALILTGLQWLIVIVAVACGISFAQGSASVGFIIALGFGAAILLPMFNLISLVIPNAAVLMFPSWFQSGKDAPHGIEATGQRLVFAIGQLLAFALSLIPAAIVFIGVFLLVRHVSNLTIAVPVASASAAMVLALEAALGVMLLGWLFRRFDLSSEST